MTCVATLFSFKLRDDLLEKLRNLKREEGVSMSWIINTAVEQYLRSRGR